MEEELDVLAHQRHPRHHVRVAPLALLTAAVPLTAAAAATATSIGLTESGGGGDAVGSEAALVPVALDGAERRVEQRGDLLEDALLVTVRVRVRVRVRVSARCRA